MERLFGFVARHRRWFALWLVLSAAGLIVKYGAGNIKVNDFSTYYAAANAVLEGTNPYEAPSRKDHHYIYLPTLAVLISPLAYVPEEVASVVWVIISFATIFGSLLLCLRILDVKSGREAWVIGGLTTFAVSRLLDAELGNGQANHLVLLCVALTAWCFARQHRGLAGVALSLAIAFKVTPALLCGYFAWRREWRVLAGVALGLVVFVLVVPGAILGWKQTLDLDTTWFQRTVSPVVRTASVSDAPFMRPAYIPGHSLRAVTYRYTTNTIASSHYAVEQVFVNRVSWSPRRAEQIYKIGALLMLVVALAAIGRRAPNEPRRFFLEYSILVATMVLISPLSRKAHFVVLMLPMAAAVTSAVRGPDRDWRWWLIPAVVLLNGTASGLLGKRASVYALAYGAFFLGAFLLWFGVTREGLRRRTIPGPAVG